MPAALETDSEMRHTPLAEGSSHQGSIASNYSITENRLFLPNKYKVLTNASYCFPSSRDDSVPYG